MAASVSPNSWGKIFTRDVNIYSCLSLPLEDTTIIRGNHKNNSNKILQHNAHQFADHGIHLATRTKDSCSPQQEGLSLSCTEPNSVCEGWTLALTTPLHLLSLWATVRPFLLWIFLICKWGNEMILKVPFWYQGTMIFMNNITLENNVSL